MTFYVLINDGFGARELNDPITSRRLWQSVVMMAIRDLCNSHPLMEKNRQGAEIWIGTFPSADFREVCLLAGLDARKAHNALRGLCQQPPKRRSEWFRTLAPSRFNKKAK